MKIIALCLAVFVFTSICTGQRKKRLVYFETLKVSDVYTRIRRSAGLNPREHLHQIWFASFGRQFHLELKTSDVLADSFMVSIVDSKGVTRKNEVDKNEFLTGKLKDDEYSHIEAHWEDGMLSASISTSQDIYIIEPSWRILEHSANHSLIVYRKSDILFDVDGRLAGQRESFCGYEDKTNGKSIHTEKDIDLSLADNDHDRHKRQVVDDLGAHTTCSLFVVADYLFHKHVGGGKAHTTANYIIGIINRVNGVYRRTKWPDDSSPMTGLGFEIAELKIYEDFTQSNSHYNMKDRRMNTTQLLKMFSREHEFKSYCLAHLFTYQKFDRGVLGLAYISSSKKSTPGGICSPMHEFGSEKLSLNTGFSSCMNSEGHRILSLESALVTAHGHNWGSEHDPDTQNCAPSESSGGKYIMYQYAVSGFEQNNQFFSKCSRQYIYKVLQSKGFDCFRVQSGFTFCGNGRIEGEEECDAGYKGDSCCTTLCKLNQTEKAVCSPWNFECCNKSCQIAKKDTVCHSLPDDLFTCKQSSKCDGVHKECQVPEPKKNGTDCADMGKCYNGVCVNYCQLRGLYPCICPRDSGHACIRCCAKSANGTNCASQGESDVLLDGRPCYQGYCVRGVCEKQTPEAIQRFWSLIEHLASDKFVNFMKTNIVGTIIIFSLILWIPASCTYSYFDKKKEKKYRRGLKMKSYSNHTLFIEEDHNRIKHCGSIKLKPPPAGGTRWRNNNAILRHGHGIPGVPTIIPQSLERESKV